MARKQGHTEITEMSDFSAQVEQMDQTDRWPLDPSAVSFGLQQQNKCEQILSWLFQRSTRIVYQLALAPLQVGYRHLLKPLYSTELDFLICKVKLLNTDS